MSVYCIISYDLANSQTFEGSLSKNRTSEWKIGINFLILTELVATKLYLLALICSTCTVQWKGQSYFDSLTVGNNFPPLIVSLQPLPQHKNGSISNPSVVLVSMKGIKVQANIIYHPYASEAITQILALGPQDRFIQVVWIIWDQPDLQQIVENETRAARTKHSITLH